MPPHSTTALNTCSNRRSMSLSWPSTARLRVACGIFCTARVFALTDGRLAAGFFTCINPQVNSDIALFTGLLPNPTMHPSWQESAGEFFHPINALPAPAGDAHEHHHHTRDLCQRFGRTRRCRLAGSALDAVHGQPQLQGQSAHDRRCRRRLSA
ncbi:hypothetical protein SDC9_129224 [bioreactor metagenome]|uniref:Uncharacterized protein n=1 Tax=bioreactor metagenome TaxID=1076179 RepID=A0A645CZ71_9ZZZZ